ncbi:MAG: sodium:alanine symporter family protein [Oscillospiraceae bacterium]|nr:sodium:alanine symporter family protein [Oscillospiraceae bacterium]
MLENIGAFLWGPFMLTILLVVGVYFTVGTGFLPIKRFGSMFRLTLGGMKKKKTSGSGVSPFAAMSTALASCLGTGNIAGVASALIMGGPGALFWMCASAFISMALKYAEVALAIFYRRRRPDGGWLGGPMYYMEHGLGLKKLAVLFSSVCLLSTLGTGNLTQIGAMSGALKSAYNINPLYVGIGAALLAALTVFTGIKGVSQVAERLVPFMSILYTVGAVAVLVANASEILPALESVISSAFGLKQAAGGAAGYTFAMAARYGVARGVFTNEAGMGSSPMAHAAADTDNAAHQGMWGALEVFIDTIVMCTLTGITILVSVPLAGDGVALTGTAFASVFGAGGEGFVAVSLSLFAIASVMGWSCYGEVCCAYLFGNKKLPLTIYRCLYVAAIPIGSVIAMDKIWLFTDIANCFIMLPNLLALVLLSGKVFKLTGKEFGNKRRKISSKNL